MKEKTIEKIPYLGLQKISRKKSVKYIGVTAVKIIGHKKHLLLEVYENKKESKKIPVVRIALTKKDFGTYWPDKHVWTRQQVSYYRPIWMETHTGGTLTDENILQSPEDLERIKTFCGTKLFNPSWWWEHISRYEADITSTERINRVEREHKRRQEALKDRQANTKALPEKAILYRADHVYFHDEHFLYYKKHGSRADIACSKCGGVTTARWKSSGAYEDQFERNIEEPRENSFGTCPMCGARGQYKCKGKVKGSIRKNRYLFLGQKYKDNGFVMRYIQVEKEWTLGFIAGDNGNEMYNAYEKLSGVELARAYFEPGKKAQVDYNKHDPYVGRDFWDDCNLYGLSSIRINSGPILPETYDEMAGTMFQYSAMKEYTDSLMSVCNPVEYLECYMRTPQLEMLVKMHLIGVAEKLIKCQYGIIEDETATRPDEFLGIRKEKLKLLIKEKGDIGLLRVLQMEKRLAENWTDEQVQQLAETGLTYTQVVLAEKYMTLQKFLNRIKKYACCDYGGCSQSVYRIRHMLESEDLTVMTESEGVSLENIQINASAKAEELAKVALAINNEAANAFDIPEAVFNGNITEKSDATNEFITYACSPVAEVINDTLTAYIVGENDYSKKCERVLVWLARFKHVDVVDSAVNLDKLRGIGFSYDELREMVGYPLLNTDFSQARALTKNYAEEGQNEKTEELI